MKHLSTCLLSAALAFAISALPPTLNALGYSAAGSALAKGGNGAGNGHGNSNAGNGNAFGHDKQAQGTGNPDTGPTAHGNLGNSQGKIRSAMGRLNAAHASATARAHAAPGSAVGRIAAYENAALVSAAVGVLNDPGATSEEIDAAKAALAQLGVDPNNPPTPEEAATAEVEALAAAANKSIAPLNADDDQDGNAVSDAIQGQVDALLGIAANQ